MSVFRIPRARAWPKAESVAIFPLLDQYLIPGNNWPSSVLHARHDDFADTDEDPVGLPFMYLGGFENGFMEDEHAAAILRDGTTQIGPRKGGEPVGDWWEDHEESYTPLEDIAKLQSFGAYTSQTCEVNATKPKLPLKDSSSAFVAIRESPTTTTVCSGSSSENPIVRKRDSLETDELTAMSTTMTSFESNASSLRKVNIANLPECDETGHDVSDFGQSLRSLMEFPSEPDLSFLVGIPNFWASQSAKKSSLTSATG